MKKIDFKKEMKDLYRPSKKQPSIVRVPEMQYLMVDGAGYPGENISYTHAVETLYGMAYTLKFMFKDKDKPNDYFDYVVPPLEGLWWMKDGPPEDGLAVQDNKEDWRWTMMIMLPDFFTDEMVVEARKSLKEKKDPPALGKLYVNKLDEGLSVQILYVGPYSEEMPTIERMHQFAMDQGYQLRDKHHEIYLSDPRRTPPEKLKTVLRHPVE